MTRRETIHRMTRRRNGWDYCAPGAYMVTLTLADRSRPWLGEVMTREQAREHHDCASAGEYHGGASAGEHHDGLAAGEHHGRASAGEQGDSRALSGLATGEHHDGLVVGTGEVVVVLSELGQLIAEKWREIAANWPGVEVVDFIVMPDHIHGILIITRRQKHPLGQIVGSFKARSTSAARELAGKLASKLASTMTALRPASTMTALRPASTMAAQARASTMAAQARASIIVPESLLSGSSLWSAGLVDSILWGDERFARARAYIADNARRLFAKRANPALFTVKRDLAASLPLGAGGAEASARFSAIGNDGLLSRIDFHQVQCSRRFFAYAKDKWGKPLKAEPPAVETDDFRAILDEALAAAKAGAVLVNPCISQGEREIARRAFAAGAAMVVLRNKGFSPLFKPEGSLFDRCAEGRLLMLAPAAWPYTPGERAMTREDACALNRIAQAIARDGAAEINYKGLTPSFIDESARRACLIEGNNS